MLRRPAAPAARSPLASAPGQPAARATGRSPGRAFTRPSWPLGPRSPVRPADCRRPFGRPARRSPDRPAGRTHACRSDRPGSHWRAKGQRAGSTGITQGTGHVDLHCHRRPTRCAPQRFQAPWPQTMPPLMLWGRAQSDGWENRPRRKGAGQGAKDGGVAGEEGKPERLCAVGVDDGSVRNARRSGGGGQPGGRRSWMTRAYTDSPLNSPSPLPPPFSLLPCTPLPSPVPPISSPALLSPPLPSPPLPSRAGQVPPPQRPRQDAPQRIAAGRVPRAPGRAGRTALRSAATDPCLATGFPRASTGFPRASARVSRLPSACWRAIMSHAAVAVQLPRRRPGLASYLHHLCPLAGGAAQQQPHATWRCCSRRGTLRERRAGCRAVPGALSVCSH